MNIISDPWLSFRFKDGSEKTLPITSICDPDIIDFALPRADFQGAAYQFAIGLLQTVFAPKDSFDWHDLYDKPPSINELQTAFEHVIHAFNVDGDGPLFMQDFDTLELARSNVISGLLIEAPGDNTLKLNIDHFVKRGVGECLSPEMAVLALFTLQINAPSGGRGHLTGLRGGGPLTTLLMPQSQTSLWQKLWLNVINREEWRYSDPDFNSAELFPWLAPTKTSEKKGSEVYASDVHPLHMYWAMPRRIRLQFEQGEAVCQLSGITCQQVVRSYVAKPYGYDYSGTWSHPLTPYRSNSKKPDEEHLSIKGQQGGITYKIWDTLTLQSNVDGQMPALVVRAYTNIHQDFISRQSEIPRLWVFGFDMDKMKARGWYSVAMPLFVCSPAKQEKLLFEIKCLQGLASDMLKECRGKIKSTWFDRPEDAKGDVSFIDFAFWQQTETLFFDAVAQLVNCSDENEPRLSAGQANYWLNKMRSITLGLFDEHVLAEFYANRSMAKKIKARQLLNDWFFSKKSRNPIYIFQQANNIETKKKETV